MARTPRMRGSKKEPETIEHDPAEAPRPGEAAPEAEFAASESLTPGEEAAPGDAAADAAPGGGDPSTDRIASPETAAAVDSFHFANSPPPSGPAAPETAAAGPDEEPRLLAGEAETAAEAQAPDLPSEPEAPRTFGPPEPPEAADPGPALPPPAAPLPPRRGPGGASLFAAALAGGVLALVLAGLLLYSGALPVLGQGGNGEQLQAQVDALKGQADGLASEVAALREKSGAPDASLSAALDALRADVERLKQAPAGADPQEMEARLGALDQKMTALGEQAGGAAQLSAQVSALNDRVAAAESLARSGGDSAAEAGKRLAALERSVGRLVAQVKALSQQPKIALAIAASALKAASDRGAPFNAELATLDAIAPNLPEAKDLQAYADTGVPTRAALLSEWNAAADAMLATERKADPDAGFMDRLMSSAEGLVSVRPVGPVAGAGTAATVARMDVAMNAGNLEQAMKEYDSLPDEAKQAGAPLAEKIRARLGVERLIDSAIAKAMKGA